MRPFYLRTYYKLSEVEIEAISNLRFNKNIFIFLNFDGIHFLDILIFLRDRFARLYTLLERMPENCHDIEEVLRRANRLLSFDKAKNAEKLKKFWAHRYEDNNVVSCAY
jgi:hypothetical protein